jgi:hypothetical protein
MHPPLNMLDKIWLPPSSSSRQPITCSGEVLPKNPEKEKGREGFKLDFLRVEGYRR